MAEETPAARSGRCFLAMAGPEVKEVPEFVVTSAKAIRRGGVTEPAHRTISALDPAMILFNSVVEILAAPVLHAVTQHCPDGPWITVMPVRGTRAGVTPVTALAERKNAFAAAMSRVSLRRTSTRHPTDRSPDTGSAIDHGS